MVAEIYRSVGPEVRSHGFSTVPITRNTYIICNCLSVIITALVSQERKNQVAPILPNIHVYRFVMDFQSMHMYGGWLYFLCLCHTVRFRAQYVHSGILALSAFVTKMAAKFT